MKALFGCCITIVIIIAVLIGLVAGGVWYVSNMTLGELGLNDQVLFNNMTVAELGLSDVKLKDIFKFMTSILEGVTEDSVVTHPHTQANYDDAVSKLGGSNIIDPETGGINFDNMEGGYVIFDNADPITFIDVELAALFDAIMQEGLSEGEGPDVSIREIKLTVDSGNGATMRSVIRVNIGGVRDQFMQEIPAGMEGSVPLGEYVYIITESELSANSEGRLQTGDTHSIQINNLPTSMTDPFMLTLAHAMAEGNEDGFKDINGDPIEPSAGFFAEMVCGLFAEFIYRFGLVGAASINLGNSGFQPITSGGGSITIVPWTLTTVPVDDSYLDEAYSVTARYKALSAYAIADYYANNTTATDVPTFINDLNSTDLVCVFGTEPIANQIVVNVEYDGSQFNIIAVYSSIGSYSVSYTGDNSYASNYNDSYEYPSLTRIQVDAMVAEAQANSVFYLAGVLATNANAGNVTVIAEDVNDFVDVLNNTYGINVVAGTEMPDTTGIVLQMPVIGGDFAFGFATVYVKYSTQTRIYPMPT